MNSEDDVNDEEDNNSRVNNFSNRLMTFLKVVCVDTCETILGFDIGTGLLPWFRCFQL